MTQFLRSAGVIARRDFAATVFSKTFLLFLLGPLFPLAVMAVFGSLTGRAAQMEQPVVAVIADAREFAAIDRARDRLAEAVDSGIVVALRRVPVHSDPGAVRDALLSGGEVLAVLEGGLDRPRLSGAIRPDGTVQQQMALVIAAARAERASAGVDVPVTGDARGPGAAPGGQGLTARAGQGLLFVLTILLAGMLLSQLIEEKSNKIIEVLAAAVPVEAIFLGKLGAMLAASLIGIAVWTAVVAAFIAAVAGQGLAAIPEPAVGWAPFAGLALLYFAMSYLLLGAIFIGIGAHASSAREVQTLSMPVTMAQVVVFAAAALAIGDYDGPLGIAAAAFPLTSPYVMVARAAEQAALWPHLLAIGWQAAWVLLFLRVTAAIFRRAVLQSGPSPRRRRGQMRSG